MAELTERGAALREDLGARYGVSGQAVEGLMSAVLRGGGTQAQFDIGELGGMGQWSQGGMTMVGDMFNTGLQATVAGLCAEIAGAAAQGPLFRKAEAVRHGWQGQQQSQGMGQGMSMGLGMGSGWWPEELGQPASLGSQNDLSYAVFPDKQRLAINLAGQITVYDTGAHEIGGISQQQGAVGSWIFNSQYGPVDLRRLRVVPRADREDSPVFEHHRAAEPDPDPQPVFEPAAETDGETTIRAETTLPPSPIATPSPKGLAQTPEQIFSALQKLGDLRDIGILTDADFEAKKADLLARL